MSKKPSRILNDDNLFFGLDRFDIMGLGICFYIFQILLLPFGVEFLPVIATIVSGLVLVNIRLKFRRKIIRDTLLYIYNQIVWGGVYNDPKND